MCVLAYIRVFSVLMICTCVDTDIHTYIHFIFIKHVIHVCIRAHAHMGVNLCTSMCVYVFRMGYMYVYVYLHVYIYSTVFNTMADHIEYTVVHICTCTYTGTCTSTSCFSNTLYNMHMLLYHLDELF